MKSLEEEKQKNHTKKHKGDVTSTVNSTIEDKKTKKRQKNIKYKQR